MNTAWFLVWFTIGYVPIKSTDKTERYRCFLEPHTKIFYREGNALMAKFEMEKDPPTIPSACISIITPDTLFPQVYRGEEVRN